MLSKIIELCTILTSTNLVFNVFQPEAGFLC